MLCWFQMLCHCNLGAILCKHNFFWVHKMGTLAALLVCSSCVLTLPSAVLSVDLKVLYKRNGDVFLQFLRKITALRLLEMLAIELILEFSSEFCSSVLSIRPFGHSRGFHCELRSCGSTGLLFVKWFSMSFKGEKYDACSYVQQDMLFGLESCCKACISYWYYISVLSGLFKKIILEYGCGFQGFCTFLWLVWFIYCN